MRREILELMNKDIDRNFKMLSKSLDDARKLVDDGKNDLASYELRGVIDGIVQTLEIMSITDLLQNDELMEDMTDVEKGLIVDEVI